MRSENQSILVSTNTVLLDNPSLTVRYWAGRNPVRLALDRQGRIPEDFKLFDGNYATLIFTEKAKPARVNLDFIPVEFDENCLLTILNILFTKNIHSVLVEGGAKLLQSFINRGYWDEAHVEISDIRIGEGVAAPVLNCLANSCDLITNHMIHQYKNTHKNFT
jgi:diaminohydroxyphosphoribosylaminopyrimidine deaminase/5-amino-6-(5-phosphoribosylamino)uracil reductase